MQAVPVPSLDDLTQSLTQVRADCTASELHGVISGLLAGGARLNRSALSRTLESHAEAEQAFADTLTASLWQLQLQTLDQLSSDELDFQPLLPDDEDSLSERVLALGDFCRGLLAGFGLAVPASHPALAGETVRETLQDLVNISQVDAVDEADEDSEVAYTELHEFVRLAVMHLFGELEPVEVRPHDSEDAQPTLH